MILLCRTCKSISDLLKIRRNIFYKGFCQRNAIPPNIFRINSFSQKIYRFWRKPSNEELRIKDNISANYIMIYRNKMERYLFWTQIVTFSTATLIALKLMISPELVVKAPISTTDGMQLENSDIFLFVSAFMIVIVVLQLLLTKLPIRIYNCPQKKKYTLVFYGNIPFSVRNLTCKVGDLFESPTGITSWKNAKYNLKTEEFDMDIFLLEEYFRRPADLYIMMGVQSDPDAEIEETEKNQKKL